MAKLKAAELYFLTELAKLVASYVLRRLPTPVESCMLTFALIGIVLALAELDARLRKVLPKMLTELATSSSFFTHIDTDYTVMRV